MEQNECMKAPESIERADDTEPCGSAHREEGTELGIKPAHTPGPDTEVLSSPYPASLPAPRVFENQVCALTANTHGSITWAKTIQVIYFEEPQVQSVQQLHHQFANRPRYQRLESQHEYVEQCPEENDKEECESSQEKGSCSW